METPNQYAERVVGTIFDNTACDPATLKRIMIERIEEAERRRRYSPHAYEPGPVDTGICQYRVSGEICGLNAIDDLHLVDVDGDIEHIRKLIEDACFVLRAKVTSPSEVDAHQRRALQALGRLHAIAWLDTIRVNSDDRERALADCKKVANHCLQYHSHGAHMDGDVEVEARNPAACIYETIEKMELCPSDPTWASPGQSVIDRANDVYSNRHFIFSDPNDVHRKLIALGFALKRLHAELTDRENWLMNPVSCLGREKIDAGQYEELRVLAARFVAGANLKRQLEQVEEMANDDLATIYDIHHCNAGWGIKFHEQRRQLASTKDPNDFREGFVVYGYRPTLAEAVVVELDRLTLTAAERDAEMRTSNFEVGVDEN